MQYMCKTVKAHQALTAALGERLSSKQITCSMLKLCW